MNIERAVLGLAAALLVLPLPSCKRPNHAPETPSVPSGPNYGAVDDSLVFSSSAVDPDDDSGEGRQACDVCVEFGQRRALRPRMPTDAVLALHQPHAQPKAAPATLTAYYVVLDSGAG